MTFDLTRLNLRRWALLTFAVACILVNLVAYVLYQKNQTVLESKQWVQHTYNVLETNSAVLLAIQDMNLSVRGYLMTGEKDFLPVYHDAEQRFDKNFAFLENLTSDNAERQKQMAELHDIYTQLHHLTERQITDHEGGIRTMVADMLESKYYIQEFRRYYRLIQAGEKELLIQRSKHAADQQQNYMQTIFAAAGLAIFGLLIANGVIAFLTIRRQAAEDNLRRTNKEMEGFTYIASHDLRSPLVNLKGFSSEMKWGIDELRPILDKVLPHASPEEQTKALVLLDKDIPDALHYIHSSVEKMDKLTNAILELSRLGRRQLKLDDINVDKMVRRILDTLHHQITTQNIQVKLHPLHTVMADPLSLEQVFGNIIDNAIKYLDPERPGKLEIGSRRSSRVTTFWIKDNGRGIAPADLEKIFEIYRRGGNNRNIPGEGMGMSYVRTTVRRMGGSIWCESVLNVGSIFYFTISNTLEKELSHD